MSASPSLKMTSTATISTQKSSKKDGPIFPMPVLKIYSHSKQIPNLTSSCLCSRVQKTEINFNYSMATSVKSEDAAPVGNNFKTKLRREKSEVSSPANESINKYLKLIKPLYVKASKIRIFDQSTTAASANTPGKRTEGEKRQGGGPTVIKEVYRSLMKSKSSVKPAPAPVKRRDDSALEQQDGIRSAILHCKRSYSSCSSSSTISQECTMFSRSASESSNHKAAPNIISSNCTKL